MWKVLTEVTETSLETGNLCVMNLVKDDHSFPTGRKADSEGTPMVGEFSISSR